MTHKQVWMLVGGNGVGKSTFYRSMLQDTGLPFINADQIAVNLDEDNPESKSYEAAAAAMELFRKFVNEGRSFCYETVFSHPSKVEFVKTAKAAGYSVVLVYIHVADGLHELRVQQRVSEGGHSVDSSKIRSRLPRTVKHIQMAAPIADEVLLFDNSSNTDPFVLVAHKFADTIDIFVEPIPQWTDKILASILRSIG